MHMAIPTALLAIVVPLTLLIVFASEVRSSKTASSLPYQAPLSNCNEYQEWNVKDVYEVVLSTGYIFEQHKEAVGIPNFRQYVDRVVSLDVEIYTTKKISDELLSTFRADPGVQVVGCINHWAELHDKNRIIVIVTKSEQFAYI
jgi:hypothetical protein